MTSSEYLYQLKDKINPATVQGMQTVFHFDITGEGGGQFTLSLQDGELCVEEGFNGIPKCTVKATNDNFIGVVSGSINAMMALMMGKVKIDNQGEMLKYAKIFGLMK